MRYINYSTLALLLAAVLILGACKGTDIGQNNNINTSVSNETPSNNEEVVEEPETVVDKEVDLQQDVPVVQAVETQQIRLRPLAVDPEGGSLKFTYSDPFNQNGIWNTEIGDAGEYTTTVTVSDGTNEVSKRIKIIVSTLNRAPVIGKIHDLVVNEGEQIIVNPVAVDPDGDELSYTYSGYLSGPVKDTSFSDSGQYTASLTVSDGELSDSQSFKIIVADVNRPPVVKAVGNIVAVEGDVLIMGAEAYDPDGDNVDFAFIGGKFNRSGVWQTKIGDAGVYDVEIVASDGKSESRDTFTVLLQPKNRAPEFLTIGGQDPKDLQFKVRENETLELKVEASDPETDEIVYGVVSPLPVGAKFSSEARLFTWTPDFDTVRGQEGSKDFTVTFRISDGTIEKTVPAQITVLNTNRPPRFIGIDADVE